MATLESGSIVSLLGAVSAYVTRHGDKAHQQYAAK
jgi:hypothetical protein